MAQGKNRKKNDYTIYLAISAAIVLFAVIFVVIARSTGDSDGTDTDTGKAPAGTSAVSVSGDETGGSEPFVTEPATTEPAATEPATAEPATETETEPDTTEAPETAVPINSDGYTGVPYSGPSELDVLAKAVLIGDSRTEGLPLYTSILSSGARVYANKGLSLANIYTTEFVDVGGAKVSVIDALRSDTDYDSVYIALGINELGWDLNYMDSWIAKFETLIETIREINPDAEIYIQAILPVTEAKSSSNDVFTKERVDAFNENLLALAKKTEVNFLNTSEMFTEWNGYLPEAASAGDGIHLNKEYSVKWLEYIVNHRA